MTFQGAPRADPHTITLEPDKRLTADGLEGQMDASAVGSNIYSNPATRKGGAGGQRQVIE